jgi:DNA-binding transcriptional LysR family regulator
MTFTCLPLPPGAFAYKELMCDPFVLLAPRCSALANEVNPLSLEKIAEQELIGLGLCPEATLVEEHFRRHGLRLEFVFRSNDNSTVLGLVAAGLGVALVPALLVEPSDAHTVALKIDAQIPARRIGLAWHENRSLSPAEERFLAAAESACSELEQHWLSVDC